MKTKAIALGALCAASLSAQVFTVDNFDTGDFSSSGSADFAQTLSESDVIGGVRAVRLFNNTGSSIAVSGGSFAFTMNDDSFATLQYGDFSGTAPAEDLNLALGQGHFYVNVASLDNPFLMGISIRDDSGGVAGRTQLISSTGITTFNVSEFGMNGIDLLDVAGIQLAFNRFGSSQSDFSLSGVTGDVSPVPEPSTYAAITATVLLMFAAYRRVT